MKKQILKLYIKTISLVLALGVVIFIFYSFITLSQAKDSLFKNAEINYNKLIYDVKNTTENIIISCEDYSNLCFGELAYLIEENKYDTEITTKDSFGRTIQNGNNFPADFNQKGIIRYEDFKNQVSDKTYKEIISYLKQEPTGKEETRYILSCSEYKLLTSGRIIPTELQILRTDKNKVWYVQNDIIKTYKLNKNIKKYTNNDKPIITQTAGPEKSNEIPLSFICKINKYDNSISYFDYTYKNDDTIYFDNTDTDINKKYMYITVNYTENFNTLNYCFNDLVKALVFILIIFLITGMIISFTSAKSLKKQFILEEKRKELTRGLAHDLKTPLFIIRGYAENLQSNIHTEKREQYANKIISQADKMNEQIKTMLEFSKLQSKITLNKSEFDLSVVVSDLTKQYNLNLEITEPCIINADKHLIHHMITNLIDNAFQHTTDKDSIKIKLSSKEFTVSNKVENIKKSDLQKLWEPYFTMDSSRKDRNGLGLSIVKNIAIQHNFTLISEIKDNVITFGFSF